MMEKGLIYHYTTIEALDKIILDTTNADKKICLLASNYEYVNDPYEISHGFEVSCKYLPEVESALDIAPEDRIAEKVNASLSNIKKETLFSPDSDLSLYITCFSENKDCLPMWNMYGNNGSGISLGLHWAPCLFSPERLRKVMYDNDRDGIVEFLKTYYKHQKDQIRDTMKKGDIRFITSALFRYVGAYIKHHKYAYEAEYRYVIHKELITKTADGYTEKIKFRVRNGDLIPYCELFFPSSVLEQIIIGPTRNFARTENALKMFLRARNLQSVKIIRSEVPFIG